MVNISKEMITLEDELAIVESYLKLQCLRFKNISYNIEIDPLIDTDEIIIPPLLLQPLVENSIKHGILPSRHTQGIVNIEITDNNGTVQVIITDNGIGISHSIAEMHHSSFAFSALKKRIDTISVTHHINISFDIQDYIFPSCESGTRAVLSISYRS